MTEFVPGWIFATTTLYLGATMVAALVTVGWVLSIAGDKLAPSLPDFADAFRDPGLVAVFLLVGVAVVAATVGLEPLAEVAAVAAGLLCGALAQLQMMKTVAYYSGSRGEAA